MHEQNDVRRLHQVRGLLENASYDAIWIVQPENRRYVSGFKAEDSQINESSGSLLISQARSILLTDSRYTLEAQSEAANFEVCTITEDLAAEIPRVIQEMGVRKLGFEKDYVTWGLHQQLTDRLRSLSPPVDLIPIDGVVEGLREVKAEEEVLALTAAADMMSDILDQVIDRLSPGLTESDVAWQIEGLAHEAGADGLAFPSIVASGPNGALPHAVPSDRRLKPHEPIIFDVGVKLAGYCSDMTRTIFLGDPDPEFRKIYRIVRQAQLAALKEIRPGVETTHPDSVARETIRDAGFGDYFGHALGHGVGLATHERPRLGPRKPTELKTGMVVTVEPGIYVPEKGGVRLEEMVLVEEEGPRILTRNRRFYDFDA
jgi:Xaa-Pro aminopeptidase